MKRRAPSSAAKVTCPICVRPDRARIDSQILTPGTSNQAIAELVGTTRKTVTNHIRKHMGGAMYALKRGFETREISYQQTLEQKANALLLENLDIMDDSRHSEKEIHTAATCPMCKTTFALKAMVPYGDIHARVAVTKETRLLLETIGKITGQIQSPSIQAFLVQIGARSESDVRHALQVVKSGAEVSHEDAFEEALAVLDLMLKAHPEWMERAASFVSARHSYAEVMDDGQAQAG